MSRVLQLESVGGASGDMLLGALVGLGVSTEKLNEIIKGLQVDPFEIVVKDVVVQGISGVQTRVILEEKVLIITIMVIITLMSTSMGAI